MTSRERFLETMRLGAPDRVPCFDEGIRPEVIRAWQCQGLSGEDELFQKVSVDRKETLETDLYPIPEIADWPKGMHQLQDFTERLDPFDDKRLPNAWAAKVAAWRRREHALLLYVHEGFFLTMGVEDWRRFMEVMYLLKDDPDLVRGMMRTQGEFAAVLAERVLQEVTVDAAIFSEPIGGNDQPLMSPAMYEDMVLSSYTPVFDILHRYGVENIVFQTYANARILLPLILQWGFNGLWACEVETGAMDYRSIRGEFGRDLKLIGGIDLDAVRQGKSAIQRELETKVPPLLESGGYVPLADGRIREDMPLANYLYYRRMLNEIVDGRK
jgi:uroporphyrinogen decarboxylase